MTAQRFDPDALAGFTTSPRRRLLTWVVLSVFAALLAYFGFKAYLNPELLFHFANGLYC